MPATRVQCCGESMTIQEALAHVETGRNNCQWTYELLAAMLHAQTEHPSHQDGTRISTTVLTNKCLRRVVFERQTEYEVNPADLWAMFRGTMFHRQLEAWAHWQNYAEARFYVTDLGVQIPAVKQALKGKVDRSFSGSPDLVNPLAGILYDYKRSKEVPRFDRAWPDHAAQLNVNRWLVDHADTVALVETDKGRFLDAVGLDWRDVPGLLDYRTSDSGEIVATWDMTAPEVRARFVPHDWTDLVVVYVDDKGPKPIRIAKSVQVPKVSGNGTKAARVADIWDDAKVEDYIAEQYVAARRALLDGIAPIPPGWERQSHVLCGYCTMRRLCAEKESEGK